MPRRTAKEEGAKEKKERKANGRTTKKNGRTKNGDVWRSREESDRRTGSVFGKIRERGTNTDG